MKHQKSNKIKAALLVSVFSLTPAVTQGAGFAIIEQSVSSLGNAYAGMASNPEDASTVYFNPAGMMELSGSPLTFGLHYIKPSMKFANKGSKAADGSPASGSNGGQAGESAVVPNLYFVTPISEKAKFGIGINAPFGLATEYDKDWVGRYQAIKSELHSVNINPAIAFEINDAWSLGFGANFMYVDATLTQALNFSQIGLSDGLAEVKGDSWGMGWNAGVLFAPTEFAKVGFHYRSKVKQQLGGTATYHLPNGAANIPGLTTKFANSGATANLTLPESYTFSGYSKIAKKWALLGDITYTKWSRFDVLIIENDNVYNSAAVEENFWNNSYRYSLGVNYLPSQRWVVRLGFAFDEGAAPNTTYRSPRVPDQDRTWLALGFGYKQQKYTFDVGYAHLFIDDADINRTGSQGDTLTGTYELGVDILSGQFTYIF